jgi:hypothetical protein
MPYDEGRCATNTERLKQLEARMIKIDILLEKVSNRLPLWATIVITLLSAALSWFIKGGL